MTPRNFFFAGKAAQAYRFAKLIIKFINDLAATLDADPAVKGRLKVVFLADYCVTLAERLIAAADVSNQKEGRTLRKVIWSHVWATTRPIVPGGKQTTTRRSA